MRVISGHIPSERNKGRGGQGPADVAQDLCGAALASSSDLSTRSPGPGNMGNAEELPERIQAALSRLARRRLRRPVHGNAAVLMPILLVEPEPQLLLTRRSETVGTHKGQISFPGGKQDEGETDPVQTALRETSEELGVNSDEFVVLGRFHDYLSITDYRVAAIVAVCHGMPVLRPNKVEVARVVQIPLSFFLTSVPRTEIRHRNGTDTPVYFYDYEKECVWGLTAAIIHDFCGILKEG